MALYPAGLLSPIFPDLRSSGFCSVCLFWEERGKENVLYTLNTWSTYQSSNSHKAQKTSWFPWSPFNWLGHDHNARHCLVPRVNQAWRAFRETNITTKDRSLHNFVADQRALYRLPREEWERHNTKITHFFINSSPFFSQLATTWIDQYVVFDFWTCTRSPSHRLLRVHKLARRKNFCIYLISDMVPSLYSLT